jgi:hypothetical protein
MKRALLTTLGTSIVATVVLASIALGASDGRQLSTVRSHIAIKEHGSEKPTADFIYKGHFQLELNDVLMDSGTTSIRPNTGTAKIVGGEQQVPVIGNNNLIGKKGTLTLLFHGVSIAIDTNKSGDAYYAEYGSWKITGATGMYAGWKGGGHWANAGTPSANNIEWDGYVTH